MYRKASLALSFAIFGSLLWIALFSGARPAAAAGVTELASVSSTGTQGNQDSIHAVITPDGRTAEDVVRLTTEAFDTPLPLIVVTG